MGFGIFWTVELWQLLASPTVFTSPPKPRFLIRNMLDREVWFWGELIAAPATRTLEGPDEDLFNVWGALFVLCSLVSALCEVLLGVLVDSLTAGVSRVSGAWICLSKTKILFLKYNRSGKMKQTRNVGVFQTKGSLVDKSYSTILLTTLVRLLVIFTVTPKKFKIYKTCIEKTCSENRCVTLVSLMCRRAAIARVIVQIWYCDLFLDT